jgi:hypothetical protein
VAGRSQGGRGGGERLKRGMTGGPHLLAGEREREGRWAGGIGKTGRIGLAGRLDCGNPAGGFRWVGDLG